MTPKYRSGLLGANIAYSMSPKIFDAVFDISGVDGSFELLDCAPADFDSTVRDTLAGNLRGLAVTIPYKRAICDYLDDLDPQARALGSVNSIVISPEGCKGFNTDVFGFSQALSDTGDRLKGGTAVVFGCGGGARAAMFALYHTHGVRRFCVFGRSRDTTEACRTSLRSLLTSADVEVLAQIAGFALEQPVSIVVNATPLGGWNHPDESPLPPGFEWPRDAIYYDLNYNRGNKLIAEAADAGLTAVDGSVMLVAQAVRSWYLWTGHTVDVDAVYARVFGR